MFDDSNWNDYQDVTFTANHDSDKQDLAGLIRHSIIAPTSPEYDDDIPRPDVSVNITDDDKTVPGPPGQFTTFPADGEMGLRWLPPVDDGGHPITGYGVRRGTNAWVALPDDDLDHTFTDLTNDTEYRFEVRAKNTLGAGQNARLNATPVSIPAPVTLRVTNATLNSDDVWEVDDQFEVQLAWDVPSNNGNLVRGFQVTKYRQRPGYTCPDGSDAPVGITAPVNFVDPWAAVVIGAIAAPVMYGSVMLVERVFKIDDPVGAISVHGVTGLWGLLAIAIFAKDGGLVGGSASLLVPQIVSIVAVVVWSLDTGFALFFLLKFSMGVRVSEEEEMQRLDISEHGIQTYPESYATG